MTIHGSSILRAGLTWGVVALLLGILDSVLSPVLPQVEGLSLGTYALLMAGVQYAARNRQGILSSAVGGGLSGGLAAVFLVVLQVARIINVPLPQGTPGDLVGALIAGLLAGLAGGLGYEIVDR